MSIRGTSDWEYYENQERFDYVEPCEPIYTGEYTGKVRGRSELEYYHRYIKVRDFFGREKLNNAGSNRGLFSGGGKRLWDKNLDPLEYIVDEYYEGKGNFRNTVSGPAGLMGAAGFFGVFYSANSHWFGIRDFLTKQIPFRSQTELEMLVYATLFAGACLTGMVVKNVLEWGRHYHFQKRGLDKVRELPLTF